MLFDLSTMTVSSIAESDTSDRVSERSESDDEESLLTVAILLAVSFLLAKGSDSVDVVLTSMDAWSSVASGFECRCLLLCVSLPTLLTKRSSNWFFTLNMG